MRTTSPRVLLAAAALALVAGCQQPALAPAPCRSDAECPPGQLCQTFACVPEAAVACRGGLGAPLLQPSPRALDFGAVAGAEPLVEGVSLANLGTCTLTLFDAALAPGAAGFSCRRCGGPYPRELFPGRSLDLELAFAPAASGPARGELLVRSDDPQFPLLRVPLRAEDPGTPRAVATPAALDFGYLAQGRQATRSVALSNQGTGSAPLAVRAVALAPAEGTDFALPAGPALPAALPPRPRDPGGVLVVPVRFAPRRAAAQAAELVVSTDQGEVRVPLAGTASTPPLATLGPPALDLGEVVLGATAVGTLTLLNQGGVPLAAELRWPPGTSTDLAASPAPVPPVPPGAQQALQVSFTATRPGPLAAVLEVDTNDPRHPTLAVAVRATGVAGPEAAVVKVDVTTNPGGSGAFTDDVRKVEATLESPAGLVCGKGAPSPAWGAWGDCAFLTLGALENPQRFVLAGAERDGTWRVLLTYTRDCASLPTALVANLLGLTLDALQAALNDGVVLVPGQDLGLLIQSLCLSHAPSAVQVAVFVDGVQVAQKTATISRQGDATTALELTRSQGRFSAR